MTWAPCRVLRRAIRRRDRQARFEGRSTVRSAGKPASDCHRKVLRESGTHAPPLARPRISPANVPTISTPSGLQVPPMSVSPRGESHILRRAASDSDPLQRAADLEGHLTTVGRPEWRQPVSDSLGAGQRPYSGESSTRTKTREMPSAPKPAKAMARPSGEISGTVPGAMVTSPGGKS